MVASEWTKAQRLAPQLPPTAPHQLATVVHSVAAPPPQQLPAVRQQPASVAKLLSNVPLLRHSVLRQLLQPQRARAASPAPAARRPLQRLAQVVPHNVQPAAPFSARAALARNPFPRSAPANRNARRALPPIVAAARPAAAPTAEAHLAAAEAIAEVRLPAAAEVIAEVRPAVAEAAAAAVVVEVHADKPNKKNKVAKWSPYFFCSLRIT